MAPTELEGGRFYREMNMHLDLQVAPHNSHPPAWLILTGLTSVFKGMEVYHSHCIQHHMTCIGLYFPAHQGPTAGLMWRQ
jgi:hypothetical protein